MLAMKDFITIPMCKELLNTHIRMDTTDLRNQVSDLKAAAELNGAKMDELTVLRVLK